jgi:uncharacterized membrane protein YccC
MKRRGQLSLERREEYLPSTTRAVAWGALFFALLSFLISGVTLLLTYKDGRLIGSVSTLLQEGRQTLDKAREKTASVEESAARFKVREQLDRYAKMIQDGNGQARFYLDGLKGDLERLRAYGSKETGAWLDEAAKTVETARDQLRDNAPEAARRLHALADKLGTAVRETANRVPQRAPAPTPAPTPDRTDAGGGSQP